MAAFVFFDVKQIHDQDRLAAYRSRVFETVRKFGGRYRVLGDFEETLEGSWRPNIPVLIEFDTLADARAWYASDTYAPLLKERGAAADCDAILFGGLEKEPGG